MKFNPEKHHRRSIRLKNYDYASQGYYFVTMCVKNRELLFESVLVKEMIEKWWLRIPERFLGVLVDEYVIMPNHFHGIIVIMPKNDVGVSQRGYPKSQSQRGCPNIDDGRGRPRWVAPTYIAPTLGNIVGWFKTITTNEYIRGVKETGWKEFSGKLWQRNYYEHIIRNEKELQKIREYIVNNPLKWKLDMENPESENFELDTEKYFEKNLQE
ncbi:MAG: transposase [FCB group bacterium]|nr:transposase [FCB group bacterium]